MSSNREVQLARIRKKLDPSAAEKTEQLAELERRLLAPQTSQRVDVAKEIKNARHAWASDVRSEDGTRTLPAIGLNLGARDSVQGLKLPNADLRAARLCGTHQGDFAGSDASFADLSNRRFSDTDFQDSNLSKTNLRGSSLRGCKLSGTDFRGAVGLHGARRLKIVSPNVSNGPWIYFGDDPNALVRWWRRLASWEGIRVVGQIPLFSGSWAALASVWLWFKAATIYNLQVSTWKQAHPDNVAIQSLRSVPQHLAPWDVTASLLALALGSLLFVAFCPREIQEYARLRWVETRPHDELNYRSLSFTKTPVRVLAVALLVPGGAYLFCRGLWRITELLASYA